VLRRAVRPIVRSSIWFDKSAVREAYIILLCFQCYTTNACIRTGSGIAAGGFGPLGRQLCPAAARGEPTRRGDITLRGESTLRGEATLRGDPLRDDLVDACEPGVITPGQSRGP
jgi:hypothetical protein